VTTSQAEILKKLGSITSVDQLAILGGKPAFAEKLHIGRPNIGDRERLLERINDMLDRRWLTNNGPYVHEFEQRICNLLGMKHCIAVCNATIALEIAIRALGLNGEVIVPSFTFVATAHALQWQEITPVFCDIDPETHNIDPHRIESMLTPRTSGIIGVHVWGRPCEVETLAAIASQYHLKLLFDAAHAFGCSHHGKMIGNFGDAEVFSFHATKFLNTFEGGAIVTNNDELAARIRLMKNFGFAGYDKVIYAGTNGKMSEVSAAMGLTGLDSLDEFIAINDRNYRTYQKALEGIPGLRLISYNGTEKNNFQYIIIELDDEKVKITRDQLIQILHAENVLARRYFYPGCHQMEPYRSYFPHAGLLLPNTEKLVQRVISLPTGTAVEPDQIHKVCQIIRFVFEHQTEIKQKLMANPR
jgi:dTDP-4-amino-4,6-dideoxygalactose transaminase